MAIFHDTPVQYLKGVGPKLGDLLGRRGIYCVGELLEWYPRTYEDRRAARSIASLEPGDLVSIEAEVLRVNSAFLGRSRRKMYEIMVGDSSGRIACKYFRVPYKGYFERFEPYQKVRVNGKVTNYRGRLEFHHPDVHPVQVGEEKEDALIPIYTETEGLRPAKLRRLIDTAIDKLIDHPESPSQDQNKWKGPPSPGYVPRTVGVPEVLPHWLLSKYQLISRSQALKDIHQPPKDGYEPFIHFRSEAHRRIIFEEFFWLELHMASLRQGVRQEKAWPMTKNSTFVSDLVKSLPFQLTQAQQRSFSDIQTDLHKSQPMHRLIQGDVGSGKTMVALMAAAHAAGNGFQSAIMVPTEILAEQHYKNARQLLEPLGLKVALLTGGLKGKEKALIEEQMSQGEIHICVGTHALIQETVQFHQLGLVIIDEQHRFGVDQRTKLKQKGEAPHFLVMTATPIPRTLAMTVYGDLDVSVIDELPAGRSPIVTRKAFENKRAQVMSFLGDQIKKGRQAYVVYPLVDESEKLDLKNAMTEFENIKSRFPDVVVGLLHGRMKSDEKDAVMKSFREGKTHILVSTTVIEVGVDVPNANLMIVEHAERFGLSQLHQLRGRVGRGPYKSYCVLMLGHAVSDESRQRVEIMEKTNDGFKVAEADLEIRGPGEFLGRRQSGLPGFKIANLVRDVVLLQQARQAAFELIEKDPELNQSEHQALKQELKRTSGWAVG